LSAALGRSKAACVAIVRSSMLGSSRWRVRHGARLVSFDTGISRLLVAAAEREKHLFLPA
jgi:hypothetical protein